MNARLTNDLLLEANVLIHIYHPHKYLPTFSIASIYNIFELYTMGWLSLGLKYYFNLLCLHIMGKNCCRHHHFMLTVTYPRGLPQNTRSCSYNFCLNPHNKIFPRGGSSFSSSFHQSHAHPRAHMLSYLITFFIPFVSLLVHVVWCPIAPRLIVAVECGQNACNSSLLFSGR